MNETHHTLTQALDALAALRRNYERYWQGLERPEPERERNRLRDVFRRLLVDIEGPSNTALAFRVRSAQQSFRTFDELCERRNRELGGPPTNRHRERIPASRLDASSAGHQTNAADKTVVGPAPTARTTAYDSLYDALVAGLQQNGQAPPSKDKFIRQVESHLAKAQQEAPDAQLRAEVTFDANGKPKLTVIDVTDNGH